MLAGRALLLSGKSSLAVDGDLMVRTPVLKASALADASWQVSGAASVVEHPAQPTVSSAAANAAASAVASRLSIQAESLRLNTMIDLPAGHLSLQASGQAHGYLRDTNCIPAKAPPQARHKTALHLQLPWRDGT